MTLRELVEIVDIDADPEQAAVMLITVVRSSLQGEPSTVEGETASYLKAEEFYGTMSDPANVRKMLAGFEQIMDIEIPRSLLRKMLDSYERDEELLNENR